MVKPKITPDRVAKPRYVSSMTPKVSSTATPTPKGQNNSLKSKNLSISTPRGVKSIARTRNLSSVDYPPVNKTFCNELNDQSTQMGERSEIVQSTIDLN